jgi:hypothetical protein
MVHPIAASTLVLLLSRIVLAGCLVALALAVAMRRP